MNLNQVTVPVLDVEKAITFYEEFGLKLIVKSLPHYARFQCPVATSTFSLHQVNNLPAGESVWVYFEIENLDTTVSLLIDKGFIFEEMPEDKPWLWREATLRDMDNNKIILYHAGINRTNPPWKINPKT